MTCKAPDIDDRSAELIFHDLARELNERLEIDAGEDPLANALLRTLARYGELIIERLNKVPDKNRDAFLDSLSVSRIPPEPAQVPLTFTPVNKLPPGAAPWVPAGTKVAAPPGEGESEPVVFETRRDLAVTNVKLTTILSHDPAADLYTDRSGCATASPERAPGTVPEGAIFEGRQPVDHEFYLDHGVVSPNGWIPEVRLRFEVKGEMPAGARLPNLQWWLAGQEGRVVLLPESDSTSGLTRSGEVVFKELPEWAPGELLGRQGWWLGCRLLDPLPAISSAGSPAASSALGIGGILLSATWQVHDCLPDHALFNAAQLDLSKDFFPLGERPRFGDVWYLDCSAFSKPQATITLHVRLTNPASAAEGAPLRPVNRSGKPVIQWERWDGRRWVELPCKDGTAGFTQDGDITFQAPSPFTRIAVNGVDGCWIRARLMSGNYGEDERFEMTAEQRMRHIPATLAPPCIRSITVSSSFSPACVITNNNFIMEAVDGGSFFQPFRPAADAHRALYAGFAIPVDNPEELGRQRLDLYLHIIHAGGRASLRNIPQQQPVLSWQYWNGREWAKAKVEDDTESLTVTGPITVHPCDGITAAASFFGQRGLQWLRVLYMEGDYPAPPRLSRLLVNTVPARQTLTIDNELLGSSNELPNQLFRTARVPVLKDLLLEVREPELPSARELERIKRAEGEDAVTTVLDEKGNVQQVWVRWHEEGDFLRSGPDDRHFLVDRQSGEIRFGDGVKGMIPPKGGNNIRLRRYRTGGGVAGNKAASTVSQLRSAIPYIASVSNPEPAWGGRDFEAWESLRERGSRWLRHRDRAVTVEDYEDIAKLASPVVVKAKCCPNLDLVADPAGKASSPGVVSLIVVPKGIEARPRPDLVLLRRVRDFLDERMAPDVELVVLAPEYVSVSVQASVVPADLHACASLAARCEQILETFFHPTDGGRGRDGWEFGQLPHESELYALLESLPEVDYVRSLSVSVEEPRPDLLESGVYLVSSGTQSVRVETKHSPPCS